MPERPPGCHLPFIGFLAYKHVALILLVVQTVGAILVMRVSRTVAVSKDTPYLITTAVFVAEVVKFAGSFLLTCRENSYSLTLTLARMKAEIISRPDETLKVGVPALLYTVQNNLLFIALANMSGALYQVTYQLKILTTALLSVIILHKHLTLDKWLSLLLLFAGVALIQVPTQSSGTTKQSSGNLFVGMTAVLLACLTSAFAGVYFEKILKGSKTSIWVRNMQLGLLGALLALIGAVFNDGSAIRANGFFQGYNWATWLAIFMQSAGGLIVAAVLKFADNILKCFGNAVAIVMSCLLSYFLLNDYEPSFFFLIGTTFVVSATYAYGTDLQITQYIRKMSGGMHEQPEPPATKIQMEETNSDAAQV